jgi:hypothetical protein
MWGPRSHSLQSGCSINSCGLWFSGCLCHVALVVTFRRNILVQSLGWKVEGVGDMFLWKICNHPLQDCVALQHKIVGQSTFASPWKPQICLGITHSNKSVVPVALSVNRKFFPYWLPTRTRNFGDGWELCAEDSHLL